MRIVEGYCLPFVRRPPLSLPKPSSFTVLSNADHIAVVDEEVGEMLRKKAIEEVPSSPGFMSRLFLVTKKDGGWRPIINLKSLNKAYLSPPKFRMDTTKDVALLLRPGDWAASIDLKDAYFHISINRRFRRFLRFGWRKKIYQFRVLPFGLCLAPFVFTQVTKPLRAFLRAKGIRSIWYLDDILIIGASKEECEQNLRITLQLLQEVGFIVNWKKSSLSPSQNFRFLGLLWNTTEGMISLDSLKHSSLVMRASRIRRSMSPTCHDLQIYLGHLTAAIPAVPLVRLHARRLQMDLYRVYRSERDSRRRVRLSPESLEDLNWTSCLELLQCKAPMWPLLLEDCNVEVATDASEMGWGIHFRGLLHQGLWEETVDAPAHINVKELTVLDIFLRDFLPPSDLPCKLLWRTDSTTAISYVRREGGTMSLPLLQVATRILLFAHKHQVQILPVYIPSAENLLADAASRFQSLPDWHLRPDVFQRLADLWGLPWIDLFATQASAQTHRFFAWGDAAGAMAFDALAQTWSFTTAYAFPPPAILPRTIRKIAASSGTFILLTPFWPSQKWFPLLLDLQVDDFRRLPEDRNLLVDLTTGHPPPIIPHLVAWKITGGYTTSKFRTTPSCSSPAAGEDLRPNGMMPFGEHSRTISIPDDFYCLPLL